jgi:hypothetical protein
MTDKRKKFLSGLLVAIAVAGFSYTGLNVADLELNPTTTAVVGGFAALGAALLKENLSE